MRRTDDAPANRRAALVAAPSLLARIRAVHRPLFAFSAGLVLLTLFFTTGILGAHSVGATLLVTWQGVRAQPLLRPDALTLQAGGAPIAVTLVALAITWFRGPPGALRRRSPSEAATGALR